MSHDGQWSTAFDVIAAGLRAEPEAPVWAGTASLVKPEQAAPAVTQSVTQPIPATVPLTGPVLDPRFYAGAVMPERQRGPLAQRCADWLTSRTGIQTIATSVGIPSALWAVAELFASQYPGGTLAAGAVLTLGGGALAVGSLAKHFGTGPTMAGVGIGVAGLQISMSAAPGFLLGFGGWLVGVAGAATARVAYANRRAIPQAQADLIRAKVDTERWKGAEKMVKAQHAHFKYVQDVTAAHLASLPVAHHGLTYTPALRGDETGTETALLYALTPGRWADESPARGLEGTSVLRCALTDAGVELDVKLDGRWDAGRLANHEGQLRALASIETTTRVQIGPGPRGDVARVLIRTRSASDGLSLTWSPGREGLGVDEITGDVVDLPLKPGHHILAAGITGMGKSTAWRPLVMRAADHPNWATVVIDPKRQEAVQWAGKVRTVGNQPGGNDEIRQAIFDMLSELLDEMRHRQEIATSAAWTPSADYPFLLVVIDEGRQLIEMDKDPRWKGVLAMVDDLYTLSRATGMQLIWATQYPSRTNGGITAMVDENTVSTVALTVSGPTSDRVIFGENAAETGWEPSKLDGIPGRALVKSTGSKPHPVRLLYVTDEAVRERPDAEPWRSSAVRLCVGPLAGLAESNESTADRIRRYKSEFPEASMGDVATALGVSKTSVFNALKTP